LAEILDRAVGLRDLDDVVLGQLGRFIEARGIGQYLPHGFDWLVEMPDPALLSRLAHIPAPGLRCAGKGCIGLSAPAIEPEG
jgi:hypothetical protein